MVSAKAGGLNLRGGSYDKKIRLQGLRLCL